MSQRPYARNTTANTYGQQSYGDAAAHENANDAMVDTLRSKVSFLKDVSIKIGEETRESIRHMEDMNIGYERQHDLMKRTKNRLLAAANAQSWGWFHLLLFMMLVGLIFVMVYLFK